MLDSQSSQLILLGKSPFLLLHSERRSAALIELRLLCALSFVSAPSRYEIRRADQLVQVDYMPVVELDIRASKTDIRSARRRRVPLAAEPEPDCSGRGFGSLPRYAFLSCLLR